MFTNNALNLKLTIVITSLVVISGCVSEKPLTAEEKYLLANPPLDLLEKAEALLPEAEEYRLKIDAMADREGRQLSISEVEYANSLGIIATEKIRVLVVNRFPLPETSSLKREFKKAGINSIFSGGFTVGSTIMLKPKYRNHPDILKHELVHVHQYERLGFEGMFKRYYIEGNLVSYFNRPLEKEAFERTPGKVF